MLWVKRQQHQFNKDSESRHGSRLTVTRINWWNPARALQGFCNLDSDYRSQSWQWWFCLGSTTCYHLLPKRVLSTSLWQCLVFDNDFFWDLLSFSPWARQLAVLVGVSLNKNKRIQLWLSQLTMTPHTTPTRFSRTHAGHAFKNHHVIATWSESSQNCLHRFNRVFAMGSPLTGDILHSSRGTSSSPGHFACSRSGAMM